MEKRSGSFGRWDYVPTELVEEEILWRLPVKSIVRMGGVCKSWYSLIRTRNFISTHLHKTRIRKAPLVFLRNLAADRREHGQLSFILENHNHPFDVHHLDCRVLPLPTDPSLDFNILGSRNGVICLFGIKDMSTFILCNPSISRTLTLPMPQLVPFSPPTLLPDQFVAQLLGFGFHVVDDDATNPDYKILRILASSSTSWAAELYSLNSNSWRAIPIHGVPQFDFVNNTIAAFVKETGSVKHLTPERNKAKFDIEEMKFVCAGSHHALFGSQRFGNLVFLLFYLFTHLLFLVLDSVHQLIAESFLLVQLNFLRVLCSGFSSPTNSLNHYTVCKYTHQIRLHPLLVTMDSRIDNFK